MSLTQSHKRCSIVCDCRLQYLDAVAVLVRRTKIQKVWTLIKIKEGNRLHHGVLPRGKITITLIYTKQIRASQAAPSKNFQMKKSWTIQAQLNNLSKSKSYSQTSPKNTDSKCLTLQKAVYQKLLMRMLVRKRLCLTTTLDKMIKVDIMIIWTIR